MKQAVLFGWNKETHSERDLSTRKKILDIYHSKDSAHLTLLFILFEIWINRRMFLAVSRLKNRTTVWKNQNLYS